jgi:hypothetical protein
MKAKHNPDNSLIDAIGGRIVQSTFALSPQRLHGWRKRGIPGEYRAAMARLLESHGHTVPAGFLDPRIFPRRITRADPA